ncbi:MAG: carboxypeptidase regulatory-like domain-containing protein [bacterium]
MKNFVKGFFVLFITCAFVHTELVTAGTISGNVSYLGSQIGDIAIGVFNDPSFAGEPVIMSTISAPGAYTVSDSALISGATYYLISILPTVDLDHMKATDPWSVYKSTANFNTPDPVFMAGTSVANIDMVLVDGNEAYPNPFAGDGGDVYGNAEAWSQNWQQGNQYVVHFSVSDSSHEITSVSVEGFGILSPPLNIDYDSNEGRWNSWHSGKSLDFGNTPPSPPVTYTFTIVDASTTAIKTSTIESFIDVWATNLSPSGGQTVSESFQFSWTEPVGNYEYGVELYDGNDCRIWNLYHISASPVNYTGSALTPGAAYRYDLLTDDTYGSTSFVGETFVYQSGVGGGVTLTLDGDGYDFSAEVPAAWGSGADICFSSGTFTPGVNELEVYSSDIYDAGTAWSDVNSVDIFSNTGTGDGHIEPQVGNYYTFKDSVDDKETVIKITNITGNSVTFVVNYDYMTAGGGPGGFSGTIGYPNGTLTGPLLILVKETTAPDWQTPSTYTFVANPVFPVSYSFSGLPAEIEYDVCAVLSDDLVYDAGEPFGGRMNLWFSDGVMLDNQNFDISDTGGDLTDAGGSAGGTTYDYYGSYNGIPVTLANVSVTSSNGDDIISPNNDGLDDELQLNYVIKSTNSQITSCGGANVKIVVDTNGDGKANVFKWEQVMWEDNTPHYISDNAISTTSAYYNPNGNDWWGYFNSLTQDEKGALKVSYNELNAKQAQMDYDFWDWLSQDDFKDDDADGIYETGVRTVNINFSWDWLKRIPENGACKIFIEAAAPYYSPQTVSDSTTTTVTVEGVGAVWGRVTLPDGGPAAYAEVNAGNQYSWNNAFTGPLGFYVMRGMAEGTYHMEARKAGFTRASKDNVILSTSVLRQDFQLGTGVKVIANITLPSPFTPYTDQWGNTVSEMWGNLDAWSMDGPDGGWANFRISSGASNAVCVLPLVEGIYNINARADNYVSVSTTVILKPAAKGGVLGAGATFYNLTVSLNPSVNITGYIIVLTTGTEEINRQWIDINARSTDNTAWAWGQREWDQAQWEIHTASTTIPFTVRNVTPGKTYILNFWSQYYAETSMTVEVGTTTVVKTKAEAVVMDAGQAISGDIVINWTPATYDIYQNQSWDDNGVKKIWLNLDAFNEQTQQGRNIGLNVRISSVTSVTVPYVLAGLQAEQKYQLNVWGLDNGFEQEDRWEKVTAPSTKTITFNPFSGKITGMILDHAGNPVSSNTVSISCDMQFDRGMPNSDVTLHPTATGWFCIDELRTGEYIVTIMEQDENGMPGANYGMVRKRAVVENGKTKPLGAIYLKSAGSISGTLVLDSAKYPTWNDVYAASTKTYYIYDQRMMQMEGPPVELVVRAISMQQMQQGGDPMQSSLKARLEWTNPLIASYTIRGLAEGSYIVLPPLFFDKSNDAGDFASMFGMGGDAMANADLASRTPMVPLVTGETKKLPPLTLIDGVEVKGTVQRAETGVEGHYRVELISREHYMPVAPGKPIDFFDFTQFSAAGISKPSTLNNPTQSFSFTSIYPGKYNATVRVWDQSYKDASAPFEILAGSTKNVDLGTVMLEKGANITGILRDEDTGAVVYDGIAVMCRSIPWREGTHRRTESYNNTWADSDIKISSITGAFKLKNLPAGTYEVEVEYDKSDLSYAYVGKRIVGVSVPDSTGDVDIGTIELKKGKNISGFVKDASGNPVPNIKVEAEPMTGTINTWSDYRTDSEGRFTLKGLNPDIQYWKVIAAPRPEVWDRWEDESYYAPSVKKNVIIGSTDTVMTVTLPNASITGVVMTPVLSSRDDMEILMPKGLRDDNKAGLKSYGAFIVLQHSGERYNDPFHGYEIISKAPFWEENRWKSSFTITGIKNGKYNLRLVSQDFCSEYLKDIDVPSGITVMEPIVLSTGATLSGVFTKLDGTKVKNTEIREVAAATQDMKEIVFGKLTTNSSTGEIESYSVSGLRKGNSYTVVLPLEEDKLFMAPEPQKITGDNQTYNFYFQDNAPLFMSWINRSSNTVTIDIMASEPLRESIGTDVVVLDGVYTSTGSVVAGSFDSIVIADDKASITACFTFTGSQNSIKYHFEGTDLNGNKQSPDDYTGTGTYPFTFEYYKAWNNYAQKNINPTFGGSVEVGNGDNSEVYVPTGSMDTNKDISVTIGTTEFPEEEVGSNPAGSGRSAASCRALAVKRDSFYTARYGAAMPALAGDLLPGTTMSSLYEVKARLVSGPLASIAASQSVALTFEYDSALSTHPATDFLYVYSSTADSNAEWELVDGSPVIDTENNTITVQTNHFSYFTVFKLAAAPSVTITNPTVTSVSPASGESATTISSMTIMGTGFKTGASISFSPVGLSVSSITVNSATRITAWTVVIANTAVPGARTITVTNTDTGAGALANAFYVTSDSATYNISSVDGGGAVYVGDGTVTLTINGSGLNVFADEAADVIKLVNTAESYQITGATTSVSTGTLTVQVVISSSAAIGTYDLHLVDNSGEYLSQSAVIIVSVNPYTKLFKTYVFPNPCSADSISIKVCVPGTASEISAGTSVNGEVRIYTVTGEQVWSASPVFEKGYGPGDLATAGADKNIITWNLKNSNGQNAASGVYFYMVEVSGQGCDKGKIAIVR